MFSRFKIERQMALALNSIKREVKKRGCIFENLGVKQMQEFSDKMKSGEYGHYNNDKLYLFEEKLQEFIFKIDDNKVKEWLKQ